MPRSSETLLDLVQRFELRSRADTPSFLAGIRLADRGAVHVTEAGSRQVRASVEEDGEHCDVVLTAARGAIRGTCTCGASSVTVCRHQVACAHALWRRPPSGAAPDGGAAPAPVGG